MTTQSLLVRLRPLEYAHVLDENTSVVSLILGPQNYALDSNERVVQEPTPFHVIKPIEYCRIMNPHAYSLDEETKKEIVETDASGQPRIRTGECEIRYHVAPFPLYPEEKLIAIEPLRVLSVREALLIEVTSTYVNEEANVTRMEGERYIFRGPATYYPRVEETIIEERPVVIVKPTEALHCRALDSFVEVEEWEESLEEEKEQNVSTNSAMEYKATSVVEHYPDEEYLRIKPGAYVAQPYEVIVRHVPCIQLDRNSGLHVRVTRPYRDTRAFAKGEIRQCNDVFLVSGDECDYFAPHPYDEIVQHTHRIFVSAHEYCIVSSELNTWAVHNDSTAHGVCKRSIDKNKSKLYSERVSIAASSANRRVLTNTSFFLQPNETLEVEPRPTYLLESHQAILVVALEDFTEDNDVSGSGDHNAETMSKNKTTIKRLRGDRWLITGPREYMPSHQVDIIHDFATDREIRERMVLSEKDGIYVRNIRTGSIRSIVGPCSYLLGAYEEIWEKPLSSHVEERLHRQLGNHAAYMAGATVNELKGKSEKAVVYHVPHRSVTQLHNYSTQVTRTIFGPQRILLEPEEAFTVVTLSGSPWDRTHPTKCLPKEPARITALYLFLGPSNMSDVVHVETRDHTQLELQLCYDWIFDIVYGDTAAAEQCFSVNDFVGNACSNIASRIRALVASLPFEEFHKQSAKYVEEAVFGVDPQTHQPFHELRFANNFVITSVDIQKLEVLDARTRQGLQKSVKMAIEIATHAQETEAQQLALEREQEARGRLEKQRMQDQVESEHHRRRLFEEESRGLSIINTGKSRALAEALSQASKVEADTAVNAATVRGAKEELTYEMLNEMQSKRKFLMMEHTRQLTELHASCQMELYKIHGEFTSAVIDAIGPETIAEMAKAGPELQAKLLSSLGIEGYLMTDGNTPINLINTATKLISNAQSINSSNGGGVGGMHNSEGVQSNSSLISSITSSSDCTTHA